MKNAFLSLLMITIIGISCQKNDTPDPVTPPAAVQYMSLTAGSTWNYELINNTAVTTTPYTVTSTSGDTSINSKSYHVFTNSSGTGNEYYNITGNDYYNFRHLPAALGGSSVELLYLKDNVAVGGTWSQDFPLTASGIPFTATLTSTITDKGAKTVKGINYNDVIHVTTVMTVTVGGVALPASALTTDIQAWYAGKYGMIQSINKIKIDFNGVKDNTDQQTNLNTADIK